MVWSDSKWMTVGCVSFQIVHAKYRISLYSDNDVVVIAISLDENEV